ncbi:uncharacterized protein LOC111292645 isoform X3 [Durio zibethinus]|uniref:Uncharacterized protein LOC111292645 isoform X3 n=1 Tax=Durio zibethinus TaxID=66656 RepID=A0A6P5YKP4_DURZI|nr:uncharacterized protein LOC111292645 isoform X3 [Durio zibethinus]
MLRLNVYCSLNLPSPRYVKLGISYGSCLAKYHKEQKLIRGISVRALKDEMDGGTSGGFPGRSWEPGLESEVPFEQRPVNEYSSLKDGPLYSWGELGPGQFFLRLGGLWLVTFTVLGVPIAAASFNPSRVLARDRLLGSYKVKPVIKLLKQTLVGTGALLVTAVFLFIFATPVEDFFKTAFATKETPSNVLASKTNTKLNIRKEELLQLPVEVMADDDLAAAAAEAADGRPVYCRDRFYRALAGGQYCKWEDLLK